MMVSESRVGGAGAMVRGAVLLAAVMVLVGPFQVASAAAPAGSVYAFGDNSLGELGSATNNGTNNPNPTLVSQPGQSGPVTQIAAGGSHSLAVTSSGQLYAFGANAVGQLGNATNNGTNNPNPTPTPVSLPGQSGQITQIAAGDGHSLVLTSSGQLDAFGANRVGQLGSATNSGTNNPNPTPVLVSLPGQSGQITQIAAGGFHNLVLTSGGQLYAFGENEAGQLGSATNDGTTNPNPTPMLVSLPGQSGPVTQIAAGGSHSLAVTSSGQLYAFGANNFGELGSATNSGTNNPNPTPALVSLPGQSGQITQIAAGGSHSLVATSGGQLYAFGLNNLGQLGSATNNGTTTPNPTPALVSLPGQSGPVTQIAAGGSHSLAVTSSGQLYAFGDNSNGELGSATNSGTNNPNPTPVLVSLPAGTTIDTVARGPLAAHSLALVSGLSITTGSLADGQVGSRYGSTLSATGGTQPLSWSLSGLPAGLSLDGSTGAVSGSPTAPGSFTITATVTDSYGSQATGTLTLTISPRPTILPPPQSGAPALSALHISPARFSLAGRLVARRCVKPTSKNNHRKRCRRSIALTVSYTLNRAASVIFTLNRQGPGRDVKHRCVKPTARNAKHRTCTRLIAVAGRIVNHGKAAANRFTFNGTLAGHRLDPGTYELIATPTGGKPRHVTFTILP